MLEKLTIGQLANIFNINIQTLYYYDKIGLLVPSFRNNITGIRTYSFKQVQQLSTILYLKKCGFSLDEIKELERKLTPQKAKEKLTEKSNEIMFQWKEIVELDKALHKKIKYVDDELALRAEEEEKILYRKKRYFLKIGVEESAYGTQFLYYHPCVVCYFPEEKVFGAIIDEGENLGNEKGPIMTIPKGKYLIEYHKGPYTTIYAHQEKIMKANPNLKFTGNVYTFDIIDVMNCANIEDFITKMEFQLEK